MNGQVQGEDDVRVELDRVRTKLESQRLSHLEEKERIKEKTKAALEMFRETANTKVTELQQQNQQAEQRVEELRTELAQEKSSKLHRPEATPAAEVEIRALRTELQSKNAQDEEFRKQVEDQLAQQDALVRAMQGNADKMVADAREELQQARAEVTARHTEAEVLAGELEEQGINHQARMRAMDERLLQQDALVAQIQANSDRVIVKAKEELDEARAEVDARHAESEVLISELEQQATGYQDLTRALEAEKSLQARCKEEVEAAQAAKVAAEELKDALVEELKRKEEECRAQAELEQHIIQQDTLLLRLQADNDATVAGLRLKVEEAEAEAEAEGGRAKADVDVAMADLQQELVAARAAAEGHATEAKELASACAQADAVGRREADEACASLEQERLEREEQLAAVQADAREKEASLRKELDGALAEAVSMKAEVEAEAGKVKADVDVAVADLQQELAMARAAAEGHATEAKELASACAQADASRRAERREHEEQLAAVQADAREKEASLRKELDGALAEAVSMKAEAEAEAGKAKADVDVAVADLQEELVAARAAAEGHATEAKELASACAQADAGRRAERLEHEEQLAAVQADAREKEASLRKELDGALAEAASMKAEAGRAKADVDVAVADLQQELVAARAAAEGHATEAKELASACAQADAASRRAERLEHEEQLAAVQADAREKEASLRKELGGALAEAASMKASLTQELEGALAEAAEWRSKELLADGAAAAAAGAASRPSGRPAAAAPGAGEEASSSIRGGAEGDLEAQVTELSLEVVRLRAALASQGSAVATSASASSTLPAPGVAGDGAHDIGESLAEEYWRTHALELEAQLARVEGSSAALQDAAARAAERLALQVQREREVEAQLLAGGVEAGARWGIRAVHGGVNQLAVAAHGLSRCLQPWSAPPRAELGSTVSTVPLSSAVQSVD